MPDFRFKLTVPIEDTHKATKNLSRWVNIPYFELRSSTTIAGGINDARSVIRWQQSFDTTVDATSNAKSITHELNAAGIDCADAQLIEQLNNEF